MVKGNEVFPIPTGLFLPVTPDVAQRGLAIIREDSKQVFNYETDLMSETNIHLANYVLALAQSLRELSPYFMVDFVEGAAWTHLFLRLQQQKNAGRLLLSQQARSSLPFISEQVVEQHFGDTVKEAKELGLNTYDFFKHRAKKLETVEPTLANAIKEYTLQRLHNVPIPEFIKPDEQGLIPNFILPGAEELYFIMTRVSGVRN